MAENKTPIVAPSTETEAEPEKKQSFLARIRSTHPRKVKAVIITMLSLILGGVVALLVSKTRGDSDSDSSQDSDVEFNLATDNYSSEA